MEKVTITIKVDRSTVAAPAKKAVATSKKPAGKMDNKARLKLVYAVFVDRATGTLTLPEVQQELATRELEWTNSEVKKTLDMLVVLKLLQKDGDGWKVKN